MLNAYLEAVYQQKPRIHCITNAVSASLCANGIIAGGGAPIMAEDVAEVAEITAQCDGLCLNLGMPSSQKIQAMLCAGATANQLGHAVVFDPVAVGGSQFRCEAAQKLIDTVQFTVIRGNISEIKVLAQRAGESAGVDAHAIDLQTAGDLAQTVEIARNFAQKTGAIVVISGKIDVATDGKTAYCIKNGHAKLADVSGSGCLLSALITAYVSANRQNPLLATVASLCVMGICGQQAAQSAHGNGSFAVYLLDALDNLQGETLNREANYEIYA